MFVLLSYPAGVGGMKVSVCRWAPPEISSEIENGMRVI